MPSGAAYPRRSRRIGSKRSRYGVSIPRFKIGTRYPYSRYADPSYRSGGRSNPKTFAAMNRVFNFKRTFWKTYLTQAAAVANTAGGWAFTLNDLPNYARFTALFEEYKINKIELRFEPIFQDAPPGAGATPLLQPYITLCNDYNDATFSDTATTGLNDVCARSGAKTFSMFGRPFTWYLYPHVAQDVAVTAGSGYTTSPGYQSWINTGTVGAYYYGVKYWYNNANLDEALPFVRVMCTFHMSFRSAH